MAQSYPFEAQSSILWTIQGQMVVMICTSIAAFVDMEKDDVLSRVHRTRPGAVSFSSALAIKILLFAVVPILTMVATDIPAVGKVLFGWLVPVLHQF